MLVDNGLRERVTLRVDGGIKTGWEALTSKGVGTTGTAFFTVGRSKKGRNYLRHNI